MKLLQQGNLEHRVHVEYLESTFLLTGIVIQQLDAPIARNYLISLSVWQQLL